MGHYHQKRVRGNYYYFCGIVEQVISIGRNGRQSLKVQDEHGWHHQVWSGWKEHVSLAQVSSDERIHR